MDGAEKLRSLDREAPAACAAHRVGAAALAALVFLSLPSWAGDRYLSYTDQHVVVQQDNPQGLYPPIPLVNPNAVAAGDNSTATARSGNLAVQTFDPAFATTDQCGTAIGRRLVLCLGADGKLTAPDQIGLLTWLATPGTVFVRSPWVASYLRTVLVQMPDRLSNAAIANEAIPSCSRACERVIVVDKS